MRISIFGFLLVALTVLPFPGPIVAQTLNKNSLTQPANEKNYTRQHPLVYEDARDVWPYTFLSDNGEEMGYNLDLMKMIMDRLDIPYVVKLKNRREVLQDLKNGRADLTLGIEAQFHSPYGLFGKTIVQVFTHSVVWPVGQPQHIFKLADLEQEKVIVHGGSYSHHLMLNNGLEDNVIPHSDMKQALLELSETEKGQLLWNTASLRSLIHMYHIENLQIAPVDMKDGEYKFMSNDKSLLARIDSIYNVLDEEGSLVPLQNKWFYPELREVYMPSWLWNILDTCIVLAMLLALYALWGYFQVRKAQEKGKKRTSRLALVMHTSGLSIWLFDIKRQKFTWLDHDGVASQQYPISQMAARVGANNLARITKILERIENQECESDEIEVTTFAESNPTGGDRIYVIKLSVLRTEHGKPSVIIAVCTDVYEERKQQQESLEQLSRYRSVFDTALVDMIYYDKDGLIADMNERAQHTLRLSLQASISYKMGLRNMVNLDDFDYSHFDYYYTSKFVTPEGTLCDIKDERAKVYEMQLIPVYDAQGQMECVYGSGRDVTETVATYRALLSSIEQVQQANKKVTDYVQNINYVMGVGGVRMAYYSPQSHMLTIYRGLDVVQHMLTQSRCMTLVSEESKKTAMRILNIMDNGTTNSVSADITTTLRIHGRPLYLQFKFVPSFDSNGAVTGYFGLCRDVTEITVTEQLLKKETLRAQEVEELKNSFLRNMSYEIRTPLNAVVGFAELFEHPHSPEDEDVFIQEIKYNSAHLLHLINDILFLSRLDAHMIEMEHHPIDFAMTFDGHCHMGWDSHRKEGVNYLVENHYEHLILDIDDTNIGRVIEQLATNAALYTEEGSVGARYDYMNGHLIIAIEDTGSGMSKDFLSHIFERFATGTHQGTGLGLPICKELVTQMGGTIEITSTEGKGTVAWVSIPATAIVIERKKGSLN